MPRKPHPHQLPDVRGSASNHLLGWGPEDVLQGLAQRRLGGGTPPSRDAHPRPVQARLRHDVRAGQLSRESARQDYRRAHQMVQEKSPTLTAAIPHARLLVLETAWKIDNKHQGSTHRQSTPSKFTMAKGTCARCLSFNPCTSSGSLEQRPHPLHRRSPRPHNYGHRRRRRRGPQIPSSPRRLLKDYRPHRAPRLADRIHPHQTRGGVGQSSSRSSKPPPMRASCRPYKKYFAPQELK